jgi:hypothetical protein
MGDSRKSDFLRIRSVVPHTALGLILCLNFEKIMEVFAQQKAIKMVLGLVWFGLIF